MNYCICKKNSLTLGNDFIERVFEIDSKKTFKTTRLVNRLSGTNLISSEGPEFQFLANEKLLTTKDFRFVGYQITGEVTRKELIANLEGNDLEIHLHYEVYQGHPLIRKWIQIINRGRFSIILKDLSWERLNLRISPKRNEEVWSYYFTQKGKKAVVNMDDCALAINDKNKKEGFIIANEAPGSMKRFEVYRENDLVSIMFNNNEETIFERILGPQEGFKSPESFILLYAKIKWQDAVDSLYFNFISNHLTQMDSSKLPSVIVNTWHPFGGKLNRELLLKQIDIAANLGVDLYQIDNGWSTFFGEWSDDLERYPNGFNEITDRILNYGMKVGLWISLPAVDRKSPVAKEHPEWLMRDKNGNPWHMKGYERTYNMCLASDYKYYIMDKIDQVIKQYHVSLLKVDLSSVRNVYIPGEHAGCFAKGHLHRTWGESHLMIYEAMFEIFQEVKRRNPDCLTDLSFELYNVFDGTDLALTKIVDMNWFSNQDSGMDTSVRRAFYTRGRVVPAYTLNFGGCSLDHPTAQNYGMFSVLTSHALFYGDLTHLSEDDRAYYRKWFQWIKEQRKKDDFYRYYKVSDIFPVPDSLDPYDGRNPEAQRGGTNRTSTEPQVHHPEEGNIWDGVAKVNDKGEGPIIFLRPGNCKISTQRFRIPWVLKNRYYQVWDQNKEELVDKFLGKILQKDGLEIVIPTQPGGKVLVFSLSKG